MSTTFRSVLENAVWLLPGGLAGGLTMLMLWWTVRRVRPDTDSGNTARVHAWRGYVLRLAVVAGVLVWAARQGTGPLLWAFVGLMVCRWAAIPRLSQRSG
jgi:F1F0 ATPase subunit 2